VLTIDLTALLTQLQMVPDQRKRRGVRYPLAVLLTIAVLAKLCGDSQPLMRRCPMSCSMRLWPRLAAMRLRSNAQSVKRHD
jgi:hypothetical protein